MSVVLALLSAVAYGASDFVGGLVSRRTSAWAVAVVVQASCAVSTALVVPWTGGAATVEAVLWGVAAGVGSGFGVCFLFRGLAGGRMSVVAPLSAVGAALVPVAVGLALGERPGVWVSLGVLVAVPGIWLVSAAEAPESPQAPGADGTPSGGRGLLDGGLAGLGFGLMFTALGQVPASTGLWPTFVSQATSAVAAVLLAMVLRADWRPGAATWRAALAGPLGALAVICFQLSTRGGLLTVSAVLASLYPAVTILLAVAVLRERIGRAQAVGLALCGVTVAMASLG